MIQYYIQAAAAANLGPDGYAYLAGINHVESGFGSSTLPGVDSGTNPYGAAGPMQIGVDGQAGNTWGGVVGRIPVSLPGGTSPPSVYNAADAIYGAALYLADSGAPGDWQNAVFSYNHAGWYVQQVTDYADSYMGPNGLAKLASDIASFYGGKQPPTLVGLTTSTATSTASPAPSIDGPSGQTSTTGQSSTSASATAGGPGVPGGSGDCGTVDAQGYANPWAQSQGLTPLRIDMGVDYTASGPIDAVGDGTITYSQAQGTGLGPVLVLGRRRRRGGGAAHRRVRQGQVDLHHRGHRPNGQHRRDGAGPASRSARSSDASRSAGRTGQALRRGPRTCIRTRSAWACQTIRARTRPDAART